MKLWMRLLVASVVLGSFGVAFADKCQDCQGVQVEDPKMHARSVKSYWANRGNPPDSTVLQKGLDQAHMALCGSPDEWEWNMFAGMFASELGKYKEAGCYFKTADSNASNPKDKEKVANNLGHYWVERYNQAQTLMREKSYEACIAQASNAIALSPDSCKAYAVKGAALGELGRHEEAVAVFKEAKAVCPDDPRLKTNLFSALYGQGKTLYDQGIKAKVAGERKEPLTGAIHWFGEALAIDPEDGNTLYEIGTSEYQLAMDGDSTLSEPAKKHLAQFLGKAENAADSLAALYPLVRLESDAKNTAKANEYADLIVALDPQDPGSYSMKANVLSGAGDAKAAQSYVVIYSAMAKGKPVDNWDAHFTAANYPAGSDIAKVVKEKGKPEEARTYNDSSSNPMDALFYWSKGEGVAFYAGKQLGAVSFRPQQKK
jgi:tetratricopeptide (TPR) repeat protein